MESFLHYEEPRRATAHGQAAEERSALELMKKNGLANSRMYGKYRSEIGRKGRGESALTAKEAKNWKATLARIERIVAMAERGGEVCRRRLLKLPIKGVRF